ncbi:MAG: cupin domain-containing protein [Lachnospiraceae bacterium]
MQVELSNKNDLSERVYYNIPDFPVYIYRSLLSSYPNFSAISHWHDDIEFILVESGHMQYNINGKTVILREGEGIFVNTKQFHYEFSSASYFTETFRKIYNCTPTQYRQNYFLK